MHDTSCFLITLFRNDDSNNRRSDNNVSSTYTNRYDVFEKVSDSVGSHIFWVDISPFTVKKSAKKSDICGQPGGILSNEDNRVQRVFFELIKDSVA